MTMLHALLAAVALASCVHRDFERESGLQANLDVVFDWSADPGANPSSMSLYMYDRRGGKPLRYDFDGRHGGTIKIAPGVYDAVCINSDRPDVVFRNGERHSTFEITTAEATSLMFGSALTVRSIDLPRAAGTESQLMACQPPMLWSGAEISFEVDVAPRSRERSGNQVFTMYPSRVTDTYEVTVRKINNIDHLQALSATLSNMADGYLAGIGRPNDASVTLPLELNHFPASATASGRFLTFGHCPASRRSHSLMIYAILTDGSRYYYEFDVSDQVHNPPDADGIHHITVDLLDLPHPSGSGSGAGMTPTVDEWHPTDIAIDM